VSVGLRGFKKYAEWKTVEFKSVHLKMVVSRKSIQRGSHLRLTFIPGLTLLREFQKTKS
jgi:hypothetical protein